MASIVFFVIFSLNQQDSIEHYIHKGMEEMYVGNYDSAKCYVNKAVKFDTSNPFGYFAYTGIFRLYSSDFETDSFIDSFFYYANKTIEKANSRLRKDKNDAWAHFFIGGINMYIASLYIERGNYLKSLGFAEKSVNEIKLCLAIKPDLYDAYLVMGSYEYLKGSFPLWGSYKKKGIEEVRLAAEKAEYFRPMAQNILALLLLWKGEVKDAIMESQKLVNEYPESRTFLWTLCKAYDAAEDWNMAMKYYRSLLSNIMEKQPNNKYNIIQAELSLATTYLHSGNYKKTIEICNDIFESGRNSKKTKRMVKEAKKIYKKAKENQ